MTFDGWVPKPKWVETTLGVLARDGKGFQTGPFGSELKASEYLPAEAPAARRPAARGIPVAMPRDLVAGRIETAAIARVAEARAAKLDRYRLRPGDLVLARRGKLGRSALVTDIEDGWICGTGCLRVRLGPGSEPRYLIQYLGSPQTIGWLAANAVGQTMPHLNTKILGRLPVRLPPPDEQRKIADALESVDHAVRSTGVVIDGLLRLRDGLLGDLLQRGVRPAGGRFRTSPSPVGEIPRGWQVQPLGELATFTNGHRFRAREWSEAGQPIVRIRNLNGSREFKHFAGFVKPQWVVEPGDLLYAWAGMKGVSLGPRIWDGPVGVLNQHIFRVRPQPGVVKEWLCAVLRRATRELEEKAHGFTATLVHLRRVDVLGHPVPVPPTGEQRAIAERAADLAAEVTAERSARERLERLKRGLMQDLFTGAGPKCLTAPPCGRRGS